MTGNEPAEASPASQERGPRGQSEPGLRGCPGPLSEHYDAALLDLDGVVYLGGSPIQGAADALAEAAKRGMKRAYVTNNASRSPNAIAAQLSAMGIRPLRPTSSPRPRPPRTCSLTGCPRARRSW